MGQGLGLNENNAEPRGHEGHEEGITGGSRTAPTSPDLPRVDGKGKRVPACGGGRFRCRCGVMGEG